jgi:hypothetical protein
MQWRVIQRESGALAGAVERRTRRESPPALDVQRGQGLERAADLGERQSCPMARVQGSDPPLEGIRHGQILAQHPDRSAVRRML